MASHILATAARTGQTGAFSALDLLVQSPSALRKTPCLVLVPPSEGQPGHAALPEAAVLLYEYRAAGLPTRIYATDDIFGERTVVAPAGQRAAIAARACRLLMQRGAMACLISVEGEAADEIHATPPATLRSGQLGTRIRVKERDLLLAGTFEATLAQLGTSTRHNLRRYRDRACAELGAHFVPEVHATESEFVELHASATNPVDPDLAAWRHRVGTAQQDGLLCGLKAADGRWLSLLGGYRQGTRTVLEWQTNRAGLTHHSLCSAMRSWLIEHEVARGTERISFLGGTPHTVARSLEPHAVTDIVALRQGLRGDALRRLAAHVLPSSNFLARALVDPHLVWDGMTSQVA